MAKIELKEVHPYENHEDWVFHYAEDEEGKRYFIIQNETGIEYDGAIDLYPCRYTYKATDKPIPEEEIEEENGEEENAT